MDANWLRQHCLQYSENTPGQPSFTRPLPDKLFQACQQLTNSDAADAQGDNWMPFIPGCFSLPGIPLACLRPCQAGFQVWFHTVKLQIMGSKRINLQSDFRSYIILTDLCVIRYLFAKKGNKEGKKLNGNSHSLTQSCGKYGVSYTGHLKHSSSYTNEVKWK